MSPLTRWSAAAAAGGLVRAAPDLEKVTVIHDPVRYPVAGAWTVAIVPFRFVTPRPRACAKVQKSLRGSDRARTIFGGSRPTATGRACTTFFFSAFPAAESSAGRAQATKGADLGAHGPSSNLDSTAALHLPCRQPW